MSLTLRQCQLEALDLMEQAFVDKTPVTRYKLPCGSGKSIIMREFILSHNLRYLILVPSICLAEQFSMLFTMLFTSVTKVWTSHDEWKAKQEFSNVTICVYNSYRFIERVINPDVVFIDEAHHIVSEAFDISILSLPGIKFLFSATLDDPTYEYTTNDAIRDKILVPFTTRVHVVSEINYEAIVKILNHHSIENRHNLKTLDRIYNHVIIYCNRIDTAISLSNYLNDSSIPSQPIISDISLAERQIVFNEFIKCELRCIVAVNCLNEGIDLPIADTAIFYDDRSSPINIIQCIGRILRIYNPIVSYTLPDGDIYIEHKEMATIVLLTTEDDMNTKFLEYFDKYNSEFKFEKNKRKELIYVSYAGSDTDDKRKMCNTLCATLVNRFTIEEQLDFCKQWYTKHGTLPNKYQTFEEFEIGKFIDSVIRSKYPELVTTIEEIFHTELTLIHRPKIHEYPILCREYFELNGKVPEYDVIFKGVELGKFIESLKRGSFAKIKPEIEAIFGLEIKSKTRVNWIDICIKYTNEIRLINSLPKDTPIEYPNQNFIYIYKRTVEGAEFKTKYTLGDFIYKLKIGKFAKFKTQVESIFNNVLSVAINKKMTAARTKDRRIGSCVEFVKLFNRVPTTGEVMPSDITVDGKAFSISTFFINTVFKGKNKAFTELVLEIFDIPIKNIIAAIHDYHEPIQPRTVHNGEYIGNFYYTYALNKSKSVISFDTDLPF